VIILIVIVIVIVSILIVIVVVIVIVVPKRTYFTWYLLFVITCWTSNWSTVTLFANGSATERMHVSMAFVTLVYWSCFLSTSTTRSQAGLFDTLFSSRCC